MKFLKDVFGDKSSGILMMVVMFVAAVAIANIGVCMGADLGQFNENQVTQGFLGVVGDAHGDGAVGFLAQPLVGGGVLQFGGDVGHGVLQFG